MATRVAAGGDPARGGTRAGSVLARGFFDGRGTGPLLALPFLYLAIFLIVPLVFVFTTAFSEGSSHAWDALTDGSFHAAVRRTIVMSAVVTVICAVVGFVFSIAICLCRGPLRAFLLGALFLSFWISLMVRTYGWVLLLQPAGVLDDALHTLGLLGQDEPLSLLQTAPAMYPGMVHIMLPYMVLPVFAALRNIDAGQLRAAQSLGGGPWTVLTRVIVPSVRPALAAGSLLVFILSLGFFVTPVFLGGPRQLTIGGILEREFSTTLDFAAASAMGASLLIAVMVLYMLADRAFDLSGRWGDR
jgi:putative spermidine/putrescine transport system permease protein